MRDGLILHDFPFENELDEVLAYLKSLDFVYLEDLICARTLGVQPCMFLLSMAAVDFLNDLAIKLTQEYTERASMVQDSSPRPCVVGVAQSVELVSSLYRKGGS